MPKFKVWDELNGDRESAQDIEADSVEEAAAEYAESDVDGGTDGLYTEREGYGPLGRLEADGHPIRVVDDEGREYRCKAGVVEFEPVFSAVIAGEREALPKWLRPGVMVRYHPIIGEAHDGEIYQVRATALPLNGTPIAWLYDKSGAVAVEALSPVAARNEAAA